MGYFDKAIRDAEMEEGINFLEHHGILGMRWGKLNGPPYPLGRGNHSASEKRAAKAAGVSVGSNSGKGSIENVKKTSASSKSSVPKQKKELTPEEKRQAAIDAAMKGDRKKIIKNIDQLSTEELQAANERARIKDDLSRGIQNKPVNMKEELAKQEAIRSGDKEKIKQYADKMTTNELIDALAKVDLTTKLNYVEPEPTIYNKMNDISKKVEIIRSTAETGIKTYNTVAKIYNAMNKDGPKWPLITDSDQKKDATKDISKGVKGTKEKSAKELAKEELERKKDATKDISKGVKGTKEKSAKELAKEELERKKEQYKADKKYEEFVAKQEAKVAKKDKKKDDKKEDKKEDKSDETVDNDSTTTKTEEPKSNPTYERYYDNDSRGTTSESPNRWWDNPYTNNRSMDEDLSPEEERIYRRYLIGG